MNQEHRPQPTASAGESPDMNEYGAPKDGVRQASKKRLFMQLLVYTDCFQSKSAAEALKKSGIECVLYADLNDPRGIGILLVSEDPAVFAGKARSVLSGKPFSSMKSRPEMTMVGRTYSLGYEQDLEDWLLKKPRRNVFNAQFDWAVWYPLRRKPEFEQLSKDEQRTILMEHGKIGMGYGQADLANDIRLACHGLDPHDNEFLLGLVGSELHPLSRLVQDMRKTQQTSRYIQQMGPFFTGHVLNRFPAV